MANKIGLLWGLIGTLNLDNIKLGNLATDYFIKYVDAKMKFSHLNKINLEPLSLFPLGTDRCIKFSLIKLEKIGS